jgi:aconitase A
LQGGRNAVTNKEIEALAGRDPDGEPSKEIASTPGRVLMQDCTGVGDADDRACSGVRCDARARIDTPK